MKYKKTIIYISVVTLAVYLILIAVSLISQSSKVLKMRSPIIIQSPFYLESRNKSDVSFIQKAYAEDKAQDSLVMETLLAKPTIEPAKELSPVVEASVKEYVGGCEQYREIVNKYFGKLTDQALFVAFKESGCRQHAVNKNRNKTEDTCIFQINAEPATAHDLELCVKRAHEKYVEGRVGKNNWSAWYAVCDVNAKPRFSNIKCK